MQSQHPTVGALPWVALVSTQLCHAASGRRACKHRSTHSFQRTPVWYCNQQCPEVRILCDVASCCCGDLVALLPCAGAALCMLREVIWHNDVTSLPQCYLQFNSLVMECSGQILHTDPGCYHHSTCTRLSVLQQMSSPSCLLMLYRLAALCTQRSACSRRCCPFLMASCLLPKQ
jgi:hypothetical protein